jgi:8-oxo-dGTP pyrophosphatase MutT (NUDIX family)
LTSDFPSLSTIQDELTRIFQGKPKRVLSREGMVVAAVLIALFEKDQRPHVLLTKRSNEVEHHKGEISFPGGKLDDTDPSLLSCALRETEEEVGVDPLDVGVIGEMDDFYTVATNYVVAPFVGKIPYPYDFLPSEREIDEVLAVPLQIFFDPKKISFDNWTFNNETVRIVYYHWQGHTIWGATARILRSFTKILSGRAGLVAPTMNRMESRDFIAPPE